MPSAPARTGRDEVTEYIHDAYRTSSDQNKAPSNPDMWTQPSQRDRLKRLSPDARTPVLHFLKDRPSLIRSLQSDSPHLGEAFKLAVDAIGQPYESEQWETLAEILMEACVANPAASMELHEVLYGVITPAGQGFWAQAAFRKLIQPFSSIAGAFRNNQPRDLKQSISRCAPDSDDFQIGTSRSDSTEWQPQAEPPAAAPVTSRLPSSHRPASSDMHTSASKQAGAADVSPLVKPAVSSSMPAGAAAPSASSTDSAKKTEPMRPAQQVKGYTAQAQMLSESPSSAPQATSSAVPSSQQALGVHKQPSAASTSGRQQPTVQKTRQASTHKTDEVPEASSSQPQPAPKGSAAQAGAETQTKISTTPYQQVPADQPPTAPMSTEALSKKNLERQPTGPAAAGASSSSGLRPPLAPSKPAPSAAKPPLPPPPSDTGADMEPFFPMPIRTSRVSVALPGRERSVRQRATAVDPFVASLPDPKKMTDKELAEFDVVAAEQRYHEYKLKKAGLPTTLPMGLSPGSASSSSAHPYLTDAHSPLRDLPSLSNWLSDPEAARQHSQTGASPSRAASEASVSNGLPPPSVPQAQHTDHISAQASVIPSRVDQLRSRSGPAAASQVSLDPAQSKANPLAIVPATAAASAAEGSDSEDEQAASVLEELMLPAQRKPYREFKKSMEARAKSREISRLRGEASTLPDMAPGAVPSLEAARAALENFQRERMATLGSVSEPLARAQAQLAELEASLAKDSLHPLLPLDTESTAGSVGHRLGLLANPETTISEAARPHLEAARRARDARKAAWAAYKERDANLPEDFKRRMDEVYNPSEEHTAAVAAAVKLGVEDFRAGRVATRSEGVRARVSEVYRKRNQLPCWDTLSAASGLSEVSQAAPLAGPSSTSAVCPSLPSSGLQLSPVAESCSPAHPDPEVDTPERMDGPPLGSVPVWPPLRGFNRPNLRPGKTRVSSRPGQGPVPVPSTTHPDARPYGVARSSLALREQAQLHAQNPGALLMAPRHKQPAREPDRPEKLPSPEAAVNLLAQVHSAEKRFETTLPNGKLSIPAVIPAAAVLGADAVDKNLAAKFIKERTVAPSNAAPKSTKPTVKGSVPQPRSALPQVAPLPTIAEHPVTTAAATEPASDVAAALAVHKLKKAPGTGVEAQPSRAAQPQAAATPASQLLAHFPRDAQANQDATADASASAAQDAPASASASSLATPAAAAPPASSSVAPAAASASAGQTEAHQAKAEPTAEGSLTPLGVDPESPTGEQDPINKQGKQRMGKKQRQRLRQEMEAKAAEDEAKAAEEARIQAEKDAEQAAKDAILAEKRRAVQEQVDKAMAERATRDAAAAAEAAWEAAQAAEQAAQAAKDSAPAAEEVHDAAAQAAAEEAKQAKKQAKKQRQREEAKAAKAAAARAADQGPKGATQDQAEPSHDAAAAPPHADSPPQSAAPAVAAGSQAESNSPTQPIKPSEQDGNTAQSVAAEIQSVTTSRAGSDSLPPASPAAPSESSSVPDSLLPRPHPGKKRAKAGKPKDAPVAMPDVDPEVAHEATSSSQQQATEPVERSASSDAFRFLDDLADESTDVDQQQLASAAEEDCRPAMRDPAHEVTDNWTLVPAVQHRRQRVEAVQESVADRTTVGGNQQRRPPAAAYHDPEDDETETARYRQERHPVQSPQAQANADEQDADLEEPAEGSELDDREDVIGLAALANAPPQRRRGVRAGRRHKKNRERAYDTTSPNNEPTGGPRDRPRAHHLPRSPLAGGHGDVGSPIRAGVGPALLPGPSMTWAAATAGHGRVPAVASDALPRDHAQAAVRQLLAQQQEESAGAAELEFGERPKPKPRVGPIAGAAYHRIPATTSDAVAAATAAAAAATAGIVRPQRQKGVAKAAAASPAPWGYAGNGDGAWEAAEPPPADSAPAQPGPGGESSLMPIAEAAPPPAAPVAATNPDLKIPAAELVAMLKAELDSDTFNCPLTLDVFTDPVKAADGRTYDRLAITEWLSIKDICPFTNEPMPHKELVADRDTAKRLRKLKRRLAGATKRAEAGEP